MEVVILQSEVAETKVKGEEVCVGGFNWHGWGPAGGEGKVAARRKILDTNPQLFFHLQQQRLIELIRNGKVEEALEFAQEELAPRGEENQSFLEELEKTVALLAFDDVTNCPVGELLDISQRLKTASEVNAAILTSQSHEKDPKLPSLLKMLLWAQNQLDEKAAYPRIKDLATATLEDPAV
ncbi:hypothetical protein HYC85_017830 [Camellia sinensis]|uniref:CTLH domain-containing protein n=1 Tax=Camellia sinensis TaxID=4442 RepID=A0A7J7GSJ7_CAMSI|nr:hypothetical protein HYC85_017830 [Camellia sinensis]